MSTGTPRKYRSISHNRSRSPMIDSRMELPPISFSDRAIVMVSSLIIVGSPFWVPALYTWAWKKWRQIPKTEKRKRAVYFGLLMSLLAFATVGPHRNPKVGKWLQFRKWRLFKAWLNFVAFEVISDRSASKILQSPEQAIVAIIPHGIVPFALGLATLPQRAVEVFGEFRPVVATATAFFPFVHTWLSWLKAVDASRPAVDRALAEGSRIGLAPGGIAEMFEGYPKPGTNPDEEYAILKDRKGFIRMAIKHGLPIIPTYCFGATKMLKRLQLPAFFESISKILRISLCLFFGSWGLPVPFRSKLLYVIGKPIYPPYMEEMEHQIPIEGTPHFEQQVEAMHSQFCDEIVSIFDRHKDYYGWNHKSLHLV